MLYITVLLLLSVWNQGCYYPNQAACLGFATAVGILAAGISAIRRKTTIYVPISCFMLLGICVFYLLSGIANTLTLTRLSATIPWFMAFGASLMFAQVPKESRERSVMLVCIVGAICSVLALLILCGAIDFHAALLDNRLQFTFQYANSAAVFFGAMFFLQFLNSNEWIRRIAFLSLSALLLTQSGGALLFFGILVVALAIWFVRNNHKGLAGQLAIQLLLALLGYGVCLLLDLRLAIICVSVAFLCYLLLYKPVDRFFNGRYGKATLLAISAVVCLVGIALAFVLFQSGRIELAFSTFAERIVQIKDGFMLLLQDPIFGVGPDAWGERFRYIQSAQYNTGVMHCGYMQIALDGGLLALGCFLVFVYFGIRALACNREIGALFASLFILLHVLIDFDLRFAAILFLLVFLMSPSEKTISNKVACSVLAFVFSGVVAAGCAIGLMAYEKILEVRDAGSQLDCARITSIVENDPLAFQDTEVAQNYLTALCDSGRYLEAVRFCSAVRPEALYDHRKLVVAYMKLNNKAKAFDILLSDVEKQSGNFRLYEYARYMLYSMDADSKTWDRYTAAADNVNEMIEGGLAAYMDSRIEVERALTSEDIERFDAINKGEDTFSYAAESI